MDEIDMGSLNEWLEYGICTEFCQSSGLSNCLKRPPRRRFYPTSPPLTKRGILAGPQPPKGRIGGMTAVGAVM